VAFPEFEELKNIPKKKPLALEVEARQFRFDRKMKISRSPATEKNRHKQSEKGREMVDQKSQAFKMRVRCGKKFP